MPSPYDDLTAEEMAIVELDAWPKDETHPFHGLVSAPKGTNPTAAQMRADYIRLRAEELRPSRRTTKRTAEEELRFGQTKQELKEAYRNAVFAMHLDTQGKRSHAEEARSQETRHLDKAGGRGVTN